MKALTKLTKAELLTKASKLGVTIPNKVTKEELKLLILGMESLHRSQDEFNFNSKGIEEGFYSQIYNLESSSVYSQAEEMETLRQADQEIKTSEAHMGLHPKVASKFSFMSQTINSIETWNKIPSLEGRMFAGYAFWNGYVSLVRVDEFGRYVGKYTISSFRGQATLTLFKDKKPVDSVSISLDRYRAFLEAIKTMSGGAISLDKRWEKVLTELTPISEQLNIAQF